MALEHHLDKLHYFVQVAKVLSIKSAAKQMGITQAGLSKNIGNLEHQLNQKLFNRHSDGLKLTPYGEELLQTARNIFREVSDFDRKLKVHPNKDVPKSLTLGMYDSVAVYLYPDLHKYVNIHFPGLILNLEIGTSAYLKREFDEGNLDIAIGINLGETLPSGYQHFNLFTDFLSCFRSAEESANLQTLIYHPGIHCLKKIPVENYIPDNLKKLNTIRVYNVETAKLLCSQGLGIAVLPVKVAHPLVQKGILEYYLDPTLPKQFAEHAIGVQIQDGVFADYPQFFQHLISKAHLWWQLNPS